MGLLLVLGYHFILSKELLLDKGNLRVHFHCRFGSPKNGWSGGIRTPGRAYTLHRSPSAALSASLPRSPSARRHCPGIHFHQDFRGSGLASTSPSIFW